MAFGEIASTQFLYIARIWTYLIKDGMLKRRYENWGVLDCGVKGTTLLTALNFANIVIY